jgi:hypothetical protein
MPRPHDGVLTDGTYVNRYFDLSYPLPTGWIGGLAGPEPSQSGYYVLNTFVPSGTFNGTILIAAQDQFFAPKPFADAREMAEDYSRHQSELSGITVDQPPSSMTIAGRAFSRVDVSGFGLFDSVFITQIRCHLVNFTLTAKTPELRTALVETMSKLGPAPGDARAAPLCIRNHAGADNVLARVHPPAMAPFLPIPVRLIVGADGAVTDVHAISATTNQRAAVEGALSQWKFKPYAVDGRPVEVETGVLIQFTPSGEVSYTTALRRPTN